MGKTRHDELVDALLADVSRHAGQGALFYNREEQRVRAVGVLTPFCRRCLHDTRLAERCRATYEEAAANALSSAEPFYYTCWAGLLYVAVAVAPHTRCRGCVAVSGFRAADDVGGDRLGRLFAAAPVISSGQLRGIGTYLQDASFAAGLNSEAYFQRRHAVYLQQCAIAEEAARLKPAHVKSAALVRRAEALVGQLTRLDASQLSRQCAGYLAAVLHACAWDLSRLKAHLRVPLALLSRDAVLRGDDWSVITRAELRFVARLDQARAVEDVCHLFYEILTDMALRVSQPADVAPALSERVVRWLEDHYSHPVTLAEASRAVGSSAPGIIKHIKHDTGKTFHELLLEIRIAEAKRLLATTRLDLITIAQQCGFCDQSHFTRQLQRAINLTPGRFRKLMVVSEAEVLK